MLLVLSVASPLSTVAEAATTLAGTTTLTSVGSSEAIVTLPTAAELDFRSSSSFVDFETEGEFAGFLIEELQPGADYPALPRHAMMVAWVPDVERCSQSFCADNIITLPLVWPEAERVMQFAPGLYRITLVGAPAQVVRVTLRLDGLAGANSIDVTSPTDRWTVASIADTPTGSLARVHDGAAQGPLRGGQGALTLLLAWMVLENGSTNNSYTCVGDPNDEMFTDEGWCDPNQASYRSSRVVVFASTYIKTLASRCWRIHGCPDEVRQAYRFEAVSLASRAHGRAMWLDLTLPIA